MPRRNNRKIIQRRRLSTPKLKPRETRIRLAERDGNLCYLCGIKLVIKNTKRNYMSAQCEHVIPQSKNGSDSDSNLKLACKWCNTRKANKDLDVYVAGRIAKISLELEVLSKL